MKSYVVFFIVSSFSSGPSLCDVSISFDPSYIIKNDSNLTDDAIDTCVYFHGESEITRKQMTTFRLKSDIIQQYKHIEITLTGQRLGCGYNLHVIPLTKSEVNSWSGIWLTCDSSELSSEEDEERCKFICDCRGGCTEIQITKRPHDAMESNWILCHINVTDLLRVDCSDVDKTYSGVYVINTALSGYTPNYIDVYCDMELDGGGWTVILSRKDGSVNFSRDWEDYQRGFGYLTGEFWAGNELIHKLTTNGRHFCLRVDLVAYDGEHLFAEYDKFYLANESSNYKLFVSEYSVNSTAGDSLSIHDGMMFSTPSRDNDAAHSKHCAKMYKAPWWYQRCQQVLLTGQYGEYPRIPKKMGIRWTDPWGVDRFAKAVTMKIRPL